MLGAKTARRSGCCRRLAGAARRSGRWWPATVAAGGSGMGDGIVLIRGAAHTAACWQPTVTELARSAPDLPVLAVDLPGRGDTPEDLRQVTAKRCVEHVVERIEAPRVDRVVVVAHSMGRRTNVLRRAASTCAASCGCPVDVLQRHDRVAAWDSCSPSCVANRAVWMANPSAPPACSTLVGRRGWSMTGSSEQANGSSVRVDAARDVQCGR